MLSKLTKFTGILISLIFLAIFHIWDEVAVLPVFLLPLKSHLLELYLSLGFLFLLNIVSLIFSKTFSPFWSALRKGLWRQFWSKKFLKICIALALFYGHESFFYVFEPLLSFLNVFFVLILINHFFSPYSFYQKLFGSFHYELPSWAEGVSWREWRVYLRYAKNHLIRRKKVYISLIVLVLLSGGSFLSYLYWPQTKKINGDSVSKIKEVKFDVNEPSETYYQEDGAGGYKKLYRPLTLTFNHNVAPLESVGKEISEGLPRVSPEIKGSWKWRNESYLDFIPAEDWKYGEEYRVELHELKLTSDINIEKRYKSFKTKGLKVAHYSNELYVDPRDPKIIKGIFTFEFNYPIDKELFSTMYSIEQVEFLENNKKKETPLKSTLVFDSLGRKVHIHTEQVQIPRHSGRISLTLNHGVSDLEKRSKTSTRTVSNLSLPGMSDFFKVDDLGVKLVEDSEGMPKFMTYTNFSVGVSRDEFLKNYIVYELPLQKEFIIDKVTKKKLTIIDWRRHSEYIEKLDLDSLRRVSLTLEESPDSYPKTLITTLKLTPKRYYLLKVKKGLHSASGYELTNEETKLVSAATYPTKIKFMNKGNILSMNGEKKINIFGLNKESYKIEVGMLIKDQVQHLLSQGGDYFNNVSFRGYDFNEDNITHKIVETEYFSDYEENTPLYSSFDFGKYLNKKFKGKATEGVFFVKIRENDRYGRVHDQRLVIVSDLGAVVKKERDGTKHFFVQSLNKGKPVMGARLDFISKNGAIQKTITTDINGHAIYTEPKDYSDEAVISRQNLVIGTIISKGNDRIFLRKDDYRRELSISRFQTGGEHRSSRNDALKAFLFTDRGIYRPGESVRIGTIVKDDKFKTDLSDAPIALRIINSRGKKIYDLRGNLTSSGLNSFQFDLGDNAPTGEYTADLYRVVKSYNRTHFVNVGSERFKVEEFLPDRLKIQTVFNQSSELAWASVKDLKAIVTLKNLFGFAAIGHEVRSVMKIDKKNLYFNELRDYRFHNPTEYFESYSENLSTLTTDKNGQVKYSLPLDKFINKIFQLQVFTEGFEKEGGRSVNGARSILVSPFENLVGIKANDDYGYIKKNQKKFIEYIAINNKLEKVDSKNFSLSFYEEKVLNVLTKRPNGTYGYESIVKDHLIKKEDIVFRKGEEISHQLDTSNAGDFKLVVSDKDDHIFSTFRYSVVGKRDLARSLTRDVELKIKLENDDIVPGEMLSFEIRSAYKGAGLITIETDAIEAHKWFKQDSRTTIQSIQVPRDVEGNAYLNITLLRSKDSKEIYTSPLSYGIVPFTLNKDARRNNIELAVKGIHKPGEVVTVNYTAERSGDIILYAIDEGILQFGNYKTPRPLDHFFKKKALEVDTYQLLDLLLPEYEQVRKSLAPGGGYGSISQQLNPFKRKLKKPVAFWSDILKVGPEKRQWSFQVPDYFNGNLKIYAVAASSSKIGVKKAQSYVRADLIITPTVATYISPKDKFKVPLTIFNNTPLDNTDDTVELAVQTSSGLMVSDKSQLKQSATVKKESDSPFSCEVMANDTLGNQDITFIASSGKYRNSLKETISLRPSHPFTTFFDIGVVKNGHALFEEDSSYYDEYFNGEISVGFTPLSLIDPFLHLLKKNPYGCTEQLLSKAYPLLAQWDTVKDPQAKREIQDYIQKTISMLQGRRISRGRISLYNSGSRADDFLLLYAVNFMIDARAARIVNEYNFYKSLMSSLKNQLSEMSNLYRAYGVYLLSVAEEVPGAHLVDLEESVKELLQKDKDDLSISQKATLLYLASTYVNLGDKIKADKVIKDIEFFDSNYDGLDHYLNYSALQMKIVNLLALHFPQITKDIPSDFLVNFVKKHKRLFTTLSSAEAIKVFVNIGRLFESRAAGKFTLHAYKKDKSGKEKRVELIKDDVSQTYKVTKNMYKYDINNESDVPLYYTFLKSGFPTSGAENISRGIEVTKEILNSEGRAVDEIKLGDEIQVVISMRTKGQGAKNNLALVDLFPGGFENILSEEGKPSVLEGVAADFINIREDRMISYGGANESLTKISYRLKAINVGEFTIPPVKVEDMYDKEFMGLGKVGKIKVLEK